MCLGGVEVEKRPQDPKPRLIHRRGVAEEVVWKRRDSDTITLPISPGEWLQRCESPVVIEIEPSTPRTRALEIEVGCGDVYVIFEDNKVKRKTCRAHHRCRKCRERLERERRNEKEHGRERDCDEDKKKKSHRPHRRRYSPDKIALMQLIDKISDLLKMHSNQNEEWQRLRKELSKIKAEERSEGRKLEHLEKLLEDVAASPLLTSPSLNGQHRMHRHLRHYDPGCGCHHCKPPRAPPCTPSVWQGPYGCEPPAHAIPAGKKTHRHHRRCERDERRRHGRWQSSESSLTNSAITSGSGGSGSSRASRFARESYDRVRDYAIRQGRRLKVLDERIDAMRAKVDHVDDKLVKDDCRLKATESGLRDVKDQITKGQARVAAVESATKVTDEKVIGLGLRLDGGLARADIFGMQMEQVEARAGEAQKHAHHLDIRMQHVEARVGDIQQHGHHLDSHVKQVEAQTHDTQRATQQLETTVGAVMMQRETQRRQLQNLSQRTDAIDVDLSILDERQLRDERRNEDRWRELISRPPAQNYAPVPWPWARNRARSQSELFPIEVEYEEEIDIERTERFRRARSMSRDDRRDRQRHRRAASPEERRLSYTRSRHDGQPSERFTIARR